MGEVDTGDTAFVIVVLIGNNLMLETMTWSAEDLLRERGLPVWGIQAALVGLLTARLPLREDQLWPAAV